MQQRRDYEALIDCWHKIASSELVDGAIKSVLYDCLSCINLTMAGRSRAHARARQSALEGAPSITIALFSATESHVGTN